MQVSGSAAQSIDSTTYALTSSFNYRTVNECVKEVSLSGGRLEDRDFYHFMTGCLELYCCVPNFLKKILWKGDCNGNTKLDDFKQNNFK